MILLTSTSDLIQVVSGSTSALDVQASYVDLSGATVTPGRTNTAIASAATTTVVGSPASSTQRTVKFLSIQNKGAAETVTVKHTDGTTAVQLQSLSLGSGYTLVYNEGSGWTLFDASGNIQTAIGPGRFLKRTVILNGTTTFTTTAATNSIIARMLAGGGQGGGGAAGHGRERLRRWRRLVRRVASRSVAVHHVHMRCRRWRIDERHRCERTSGRKHHACDRRDNRHV